MFFYYFCFWEWYLSNRGQCLYAWNMNITYMKSNKGKITRNERGNGSKCESKYKIMITT